ncbi:MAG TPA: DUF3344 domain-containing protein, partial [Polyangium sp.]|nr:DUF3344 domain-containing protein [Polyangium sp.]
MRRRTALGSIVATLVCVTAGTASAELTQRVQVTQRGDFVLIGNTLAQDCGASVPAPVVGTIGMCGANTSDSAPDVYWRSDSPLPGQATADLTVLPGLARTTANLSVPIGATVTHAYLYWAARSGSPNGDPDLSVTLDVPGAALPLTVDAVDSAVGASTFTNAFQAVADITQIVQQHGSGAYALGGVNAFALANVNNSTPFAGWWMVVLYELPSEPPRNIALFDGFEEVAEQNAKATISGFKVPLAGFNAKLGVVAYDGDQTTGDSLYWNGVELSNGLNPAGNFFNSTRSFLGMPVSVVGDLPQLTGGVGSMSGIDLDILDITGNVMPGSTSAEIEAGITGIDTYALGGFITSISTLKPDFTTSGKSVADLNGGVVDPGDELEYTLVVTNSGDDSSKDTILTDKLPAEVTYVPGTLEIVSGPNMGAKTDAAADDQGEFDAGSSTVTVRLGAGANGTVGGSLNVGQSTSVRFRVTVNPGVGGSILNQGVINASGTQGAPAEDTPTDGNGGDPGAPPTVIIIDSDGDGLSNDDENAAGT